MFCETREIDPEEISTALISYKRVSQTGLNPSETSGKTPRNETSRRVKDPLCYWNMAFRLNNKALLTRNRVFCSFRIPHNPNLLTKRKGLLRSIRTPSHQVTPLTNRGNVKLASSQKYPKLLNRFEMIINKLRNGPPSRHLLRPSHLHTSACAARHVRRMRYRLQIPACRTRFSATLRETLPLGLYFG